MSVGKLSRYIHPNQLTQEFGGKLYYDHQRWIRNQISYEKYMTEAIEKVDNYQNHSNASLTDQVRNLFFVCRSEVDCLNLLFHLFLVFTIVSFCSYRRVVVIVPDFARKGLKFKTP